MSKDNSCIKVVVLSLNKDGFCTEDYIKQFRIYDGEFNHEFTNCHRNMVYVSTDKDCYLTIGSENILLRSGFSFLIEEFNGKIDILNVPIDSNRKQTLLKFVKTKKYICIEK